MTSIRGQMIALQEELDWEVYWLYGLLTDQEAVDLQAEPRQRPRSSSWASGHSRSCWPGGWQQARLSTQWFARHGSTPITEIPAHWPEAYRQVVERRIEVIERAPGYRADRAAGVQAALVKRAVGEEGTGGAAVLAAGPVRGPQPLVRP